MIRVSIDDPGVAAITLDRPDRGNALRAADVRELRTAIAGLGRETGLVVLRGAGGRAFCGGADAGEMVAMKPTERRRAVTEFCNLAIEIWRQPALTVSLLDGYAIGGGAHLALSTDLRFATGHSWLQFPAGRYGLGLSAVWLGSLIGTGRAARIMGSASRIPCDEAVRLGLVDAEIDDASALPPDLADAPPADLAAAKRFARRSRPPHLESALAAEREHAVEMAESERFVELLGRERSAEPRDRD